MGEILIMESDPLVRGLLTEWLEEAGYRVRQSSALPRWPAPENRSVVLIIADIESPKSRGMQTVSRLRQSHSDIPIIVTSAHFRSDLGSRSAAELYGACRLLPKPYSRAQLLEAVAAVLHPMAQARNNAAER